jgi:hypothetical protein
VCIYPGAAAQLRSAAGRARDPAFKLMAPGGDGWTDYQTCCCCCCLVRPTQSARSGCNKRTDYQTCCCCLARPAPAARRAATNGRTTRPAAAASPGRPQQPGRAARATDGRTTRPAAAASLGRPQRPHRAATDGRTTRPAAAASLSRPQRTGRRSALGAVNSSEYYCGSCSAVRRARAAQPAARREGGSGGADCEGGNGKCGVRRRPGAGGLRGGERHGRASDAGPNLYNRNARPGRHAVTGHREARPESVRRSDGQPSRSLLRRATVAESAREPESRSAPGRGRESPRGGTGQADRDSALCKPVRHSSYSG